jgi:mono/diheme cytochrome c family protein
MNKKTANPVTVAVLATVVAGTATGAVATGATGAAPTAAVPTGAAHAAPSGHQPPIYWSPTPIASKPGEPPGYALFQRACAVCHGSGPARPGTRALAVKYKNSLPALLEERTDLKAPYIKQAVRQGLTVMPLFRKTELSDADLDAITTYLTRKRP